MEEATQEKHVLTILVSNKPGVLIRIALIFSRRGYNIHCLVTHPTHDPTRSVITITSFGDRVVMIQILKQLNKLVDVIHASDRTSDKTVQRELALVKVAFTEQNRSDILLLIKSFNTSIVDISNKSIIISFSGTELELDPLEALLSKFGIIEIIRTGSLVMLRGDNLST